MQLKPEVHCAHRVGNEKWIWTFGQFVDLAYVWVTSSDTIPTGPTSGGLVQVCCCCCCCWQCKSLHIWPRPCAPETAKPVLPESVSWSGIHL